MDHLSLYDVVNTPGVTADLSHISSVAKIDGFLPKDDGMKKAFEGADIVVIPAGIPRKNSLQDLKRQNMKSGDAKHKGHRQAWHDPRRPLQDQCRHCA